VSKVVSRLNANGLSAIEAMLARQRRKAEEAAAAAAAAEAAEAGTATAEGGAHAGAPQSQILEVADACDGDRGASSVWLSKRLVEHFETRLLPRDKVESEVRSQIKRILARRPHAESSSSCDERTAVQNIDLVGVLIDVPHERQIGPCCGIAALRCVRAYWKGRQDSYENKKGIMGDLRCEFEQTTRTTATARLDTSSLLDFARQRGWSSDGEMFHAVNLARLAGSPPGGLSSAVYIDVTRSVLVDLVARQGVPVLISFDKSNRSQEFLLDNDARGARAHWGIVRGIVCSAAAAAALAEVPPISGNAILNKETSRGVRATRVRLFWADNGDKQAGESDAIAEPREGLVGNVEFAEGKGGEEILFVVLQHTASDQVSVVSFDRLVRSNAQLDDDAAADNDGGALPKKDARSGSTAEEAAKIILDGLGYVRGGQALSGRWVVCWAPSAPCEV
jgi:hypothetical protein